MSRLDTGRKRPEIPWARQARRIVNGSKAAVKSLIGEYGKDAAKMSKHCSLLEKAIGTLDKFKEVIDEMSEAHNPFISKAIGDLSKIVEEAEGK